jgi:hypothetical protein
MESECFFAWGSNVSGQNSSRHPVDLLKLLLLLVQQLAEGLVQPTEHAKVLLMH